MKKIIILCSVFLIMVSCDEIDLEIADSNVPVVESYIHPGKEVIVTIKKQLVYNSNDTTVQYLDGLDVTLSDGTNTSLLINDSTGIYRNPDILIAENVEYTIEFIYNNKVVSAVTETPSKPTGFSASATTIEALSFDDFTPGSGTPPEMPDPVTLTYSNPDNDYHMIVVECTELNPTLIDTSTDKPIRTFRTQPVQTTSLELNSRQFVYYGAHRLILFKLNSEYAALYEQIQTSSLDIEAPPSNVENGLGIFTGINTDTLYIEVVSQ